jgi:uncharacterized protein YbaP (TraB family)
MAKNTKYVAAFLLSWLCMAAMAQSKYPSVLWEIKKNPTDAPSFLLGTYHLSNKGVFKFGDSLLWAMKKVDAVGTELNMGIWQREDNRMDKYNAAYNLYTGKFSPQGFTQASLQKTNTIEKLPEFIKIVPSFINYFLYRNNPASEGLQEEAYLDRFVASLGYKLGKQVVGLEDLVSSKVLEIEGIKNEAAAEKKDNLKLPDGLTMQDMVDKIYDGYLNNNLDALDSFLVYEHSKEYGDKFIVARNYVQADSMLAIMKQGKTIFAAVGCSHLVGEEGIINILRKRGYTLRPVKLSGGNDTQASQLKERVYPTPLTPVQIFDNISCQAPGEFYPYNATPIYKSAGHIDFANGAFYVVEKLVNNALYYGYPEAKLLKAIDSLLYANIRGDIVKKEMGRHGAYQCINVVCKIKNKDIERYQFIVTPYEIIKVKVGGKNEFAYSAWVDSFFNSIDIHYPAAPLQRHGFTIADQYPLYATVEQSDEYFDARQRFVYYDSTRAQLNTVLKIKLHASDQLYDSIIDVAVADSYFSSSLYGKKMRHQLLPKNKLQSFPLTDKKVLHLQYQLEFPYAYIISSLADSGKVDAGFIQSFALRPLQYETLYSYVDTGKNLQMKLPYRLGLREDLKKVRDRRVKNSSRNYTTKDEVETHKYQPSMYAEDYDKEMIEFEDKYAMENTFGNIIYFDSAARFSSARIFWKQLLWPNSLNNSTSRDYGEYISTSSSNSPFRFNWRNNKMMQLQLDTTAANIQTASFWAIDTMENKKIFYKFMLFDDRVVELYANGHKNEMQLSPFARIVFDNFAPFRAQKKAMVYAQDFTQLLDGYMGAKQPQRDTLLKKMNHYYLQASDIPTVNQYFAKLQPTKVADNILKRKLLDMVGNSTLAVEQWPSISAWLRTIFENQQELLTIRTMAAELILEQQNAHDAAWVLEHIYRPGNPFREYFKDDIMRYLKHTYPKQELIKKVQLPNFVQKEELLYITLIDSGYGTPKEWAAAFASAKQFMGVTEMADKIAAEKQLFTFEKADINALRKNDDDNEDRPVQRIFLSFFKHFPTDKFFADEYQQYIKENNYRGILGALRGMLKADKYPESMVNAGLKKLQEAKRYWPELNGLFYKAKMYHKLPASFKDRREICKYLLADKERYSPSDSIVFIKTVKHPYTTDSVYFYYYVKSKSAPRKLAFIIYKNDQSIFGDNETQQYNFTDERYSFKDNMDETIVDLLKKQYIGKYLRDGRYGYMGKGLEKELYSAD